MPGKQDGFQPSSGYFNATAQPLLSYISFAFGLSGTQYLSLRFKEYLGQLSKTPGWFSQERFDIQARAEGYPTKDQMRAMMRTLLAERFKLAVHLESRAVQVEALVSARAGRMGTYLRVHPDEDDCTTPATIGPDAAGLPPVCHLIARLVPGGEGRMRVGGRGVPLDLLASSLPTQTGMATLPHPVVDRTGLNGLYDFVLEWKLEPAGGEPAPADATGASFSQALKEQLGFRLMPQRAPVDLLVIDHVEEPSPN